MGAPPALGQIVVLNGAPRSGKSAIVAAIQESFDGVWVNLGVDVARAATPARLQPGIGLRPGEEAHVVAPLVPLLYAALYESVAAHSRLGIDVVVDVGHYDRSVLADCAGRLTGLPVLFVGVRCPVDVIVERRKRAPAGHYATSAAAAVRWQDAVHAHWTYDVEVDTSVFSPKQCAEAIRARLAGRVPTAFARLVS